MVLTNVFATFRVTSCLLKQMFRMWHIYYLSQKLANFARLREQKKEFSHNYHIQIARVDQAFIFELATDEFLDKNCNGFGSLFIGMQL